MENGIGMEGGKESRSKFGFSWADEVEREEEEEKQEEQEKQINDQNPVQRGKEVVEKPAKKIDPFGAARPREVVLEEKGVDWKKLDQDFDFDSTIRECKTNKRVTKKKLLVIQNSQKTLLQYQKAGSCEELVPPLKYAPKNIDSVFEEIRRSRKPKPSNNTRENSKASDRCNENIQNNTVLVGCSDAKRHNAQWVPKGSASGKTLPSLNSVLVKSNTKSYAAKEKTASNFEPKSVKDDEHGQRRVLVELSNFSSSNSYFGVLDSLEPSSCEKSSSKKRSAVSGNKELGSAGKKKNQERLTAGIINRRKKEKRSKRMN